MLRRALPVLLASCSLLEGCRDRLTPPAPSPAAPAAISFRRDIAPTLDLHCAPCHGARKNREVVIDLRPAAAWANLVDRPAEKRDGWRLVKPGDSGASFLVDKLAGNLRPVEGKAMPLDALTKRPMVPSPVAQWLETKLLPWIDGGAPSN